MGGLLPCPTSPLIVFSLTWWLVPGSIGFLWHVKMTVHPADIGEWCSGQGPRSPRGAKRFVQTLCFASLILPKNEEGKTWSSVILGAVP